MTDSILKGVIAPDSGVPSSSRAERTLAYSRALVGHLGVEAAPLRNLLRENLALLDLLAALGPRLLVRRDA